MLLISAGEKARDSQMGSSPKTHSASVRPPINDPDPHLRKSYKFLFYCFPSPIVNIFRDLVNFSTYHFRFVSGPIKTHSKTYTCFFAMVTFSTLSFSPFQIFQMSLNIGEYHQHKDLADSLVSKTDFVLFFLHQFLFQK